MHISSGIEAQEILGEQPGSKTGKETEPVKQGPWAGARQLWGFIPGWGFWELVTSYSDVPTWNVRGEYLWCVRCHPPVTETSGKAEPPQDPAEKQAGAALRVEALLNSWSSGVQLLLTVLPAFLAPAGILEVKCPVMLYYLQLILSIFFSDRLNPKKQTTKTELLHGV